MQIYFGTDFAVHHELLKVTKVIQSIREDYENYFSISRVSLLLFFILAVSL